MNRYLKRLDERGVGGTGRASERKVAAKLGARPTPASGALKGAKGDMVLPEVLVEAKSTTANSMKLDFGWLVKIATEALNSRKTPCLAVSFTEGDGRPKRHGEWMMVPLHVWREMTGY